MSLKNPMSLKNVLASACAVFVLVLPASALADQGPGNAVPPDQLPSTGPCATMRATPPVQRANRKAAVDLRYNVSNCSDSTEEVSVSVAGTLEPTGPDALPLPCVAWDAGTVTLKPHATRSLVSQIPSSLCALGPDGGTFTYEATATNVADGSVLATETSQLIVNLGF